MNKNAKNFVLGIMEECNKISQYCSKALKFGIFSHHPNEHTTNGDKILTKYYRLQGLIESLQRERLLPTYNKKYIDALKREGCSYHKSNNVKDIGGRR